MFCKILQISVENTNFIKNRLQHNCFLVKNLRTPFNNNAGGVFLRQATITNLFKDVSAISFMHNQSLITCISYNDKLI